MTLPADLPFPLGQEETPMALVSVDTADLEALDAALDAVTAALAEKLAVLAPKLDPADLAPLQDDLAKLQELSAPTPVEPPV